MNRETIEIPDIPKYGEDFRPHPYVYFHIWDGHFKMWGFQYYGSHLDGTARVIFYWGRIKNSISKLMKKELKHSNLFDLYDEVQKRIEDKLRKGYIAIPLQIYTRYTFGRITLSQLISLIEKQKETAK